MEITSRERDGVHIVVLVGRLTLGGGAKAVYSAVRRELDNGRKSLLLDLSRVTLLDSTGLGVLVSCLTSAASRGARLKLLRPSPKVEDVLQITQTDQLFEIFHDEEEAIRSFQDPEDQ